MPFSSKGVDVKKNQWFHGVFCRRAVPSPIVASDVSEFCDLVFDEDEDMHYREQNAFTGMGFGAQFEPQARAPSQPIFGIYPFS